jgi:hypothetical protein
MLPAGMCVTGVLKGAVYEGNVFVHAEKTKEARDIATPSAAVLHMHATAMNVDPAKRAAGNMFGEWTKEVCEAACKHVHGAVSYGAEHDEHKGILKRMKESEEIDVEDRNKTEGVTPPAHPDIKKAEVRRLFSFTSQSVMFH